MTTELTLREKVLAELGYLFERSLRPEDAIGYIADLLSATGASAYIQVADDLRGVVREEGAHDKLEFWPRHLAASADLYLNRMNETGGEGK